MGDLSARMTPSGSGKLTLVERLVNLLRLPYPLGCLVIAALITVVGEFVSIYADTGSVAEALRRTSINNGLGIQPTGPAPVLNGLIAAFLYLGFVFMAMLGTRIIRSRIVAAEDKLSQLSADKEAYKVAFGGVSNQVIAIIGGLGASLLFIPVQISVYSGYAYLVFSVIALPLQGLVDGTFFWMYFRSLWGIYKFGRSPLKFKPYYEDRMLGLRPLGSISLYCLSAVFSLVILSLAGTFLLPPDPTALAVFIPFMASGLALFFLPLWKIHGRMVAEKAREQELLDKKFAEMVKTPNLSGSTAGEILAFDVVERRVTRIHTWPFDTGILGRLAAILLSVLATIIARILILALLRL